MAKNQKIEQIQNSHSLIPKWFSFNPQNQKVEEITPSEQSFSNPNLWYWSRGLKEWEKGARAWEFFTNPTLSETSEKIFKLETKVPQVSSGQPILTPKLKSKRNYSKKTRKSKINKNSN